MTDIAYQNVVLDYANTNAWLQRAAVDAGAGKDIYPPKPSTLDAHAIVSDFLSYMSATIGVLEHFKGNCIQFEQTGRIFTTEHALTQAILEDSASRGVAIDDRMIAFVSTSAHAVSSDAVFLHFMLNSLDGTGFTNPLLPTTVNSIRTTSTTGNKADVSAKAGLSIGVGGLKLGAGGSASKSSSDEAVRDTQIVGDTRVDAKYRDTLTCVSTIYSLENAGVLPTGQFMKTLASIASVNAEYTGDAGADKIAANQIIADPSLSFKCINDAWMLSNRITDFLLEFCNDNAVHAMQKVPPSREETDFWMALHHAAEFGHMTSRNSMQRYIDHHDHPEASMAFSLLKMWEMMDKTAAKATRFLRLGLDNSYFSTQTTWLQSRHILRSIQLSPVLPDDRAVIILQDIESRKVRTESVRLLDAMDMFPDIAMYTEGSPDNPRLRDDAMESAIICVNSINDKLYMDYTTGMHSVVEMDSAGVHSLNIHREHMPRERQKSRW